MQPFLECIILPVTKQRFTRRGERLLQAMAQAHSISRYKTRRTLAVLTQCNALLNYKESLQVNLRLNILDYLYSVLSNVNFLLVIVIFTAQIFLFIL